MIIQRQNIILTSLLLIGLTAAISSCAAKDLTESDVIGSWKSDFPGLTAELKADGVVDFEALPRDVICEINGEGPMEPPSLDDAVNIRGEWSLIDGTDTWILISVGKCSLGTPLRQSITGNLQFNWYYGVDPDIDTSGILFKK